MCARLAVLIDAPIACVYRQMDVPLTTAVLRAWGGKVTESLRAQGRPGGGLESSAGLRGDALGYDPSQHDHNLLVGAHMVEWTSLIT